MSRSLCKVVLLCLAGCPRPVPEHLQVQPKKPPPSTVEITDVRSALKAMVGRDPLARSPVLPDPQMLEELPDGAPLAAFVRQVHSAELGQGAMDRLLQQVEDEWRGTPAVPLSRGYRLRLAENQLANKLGESEATEQSIVTLITPLTPGIADPTLPRRPLEWLGSGALPPASSEEPAIDPDSDRTASVRRYAERWVLVGWLSSPTIPVEVLVEPLEAPQYDALRTSGLGALLVARAQGANAEPEPGMARLRRATSLALMRAAADRDSEQAKWAEEKARATAETGDEDPVGKLLEQAATELSAGAGQEKAAGGALLALGALRWVDRCETPPCTGLDRVETFAHAARWDPEIAELASVWQVVAFKETLDSLDVGRDSPLFPQLAVDLTDVLVGTGAGPLEAPLLRKQRPDPQTWLVVARAVGSEGVSDWEGARVALGQHLQAEAERASAATTDTSFKELLDRIAKRAVP
jgi:hypothetical protein